MPQGWLLEWPQTEFALHSVPLQEIISGGPPKDGIPSIDHPKFVPLSRAAHLSDRKAVIGLVLDGHTKAYPLQVLHWHEIVNDEIAGVLVAVTYCPLCNVAIVFDRHLDGHVLQFGTTGKLRHSDLVMYDRLTESWWRQFTGRASVGALTGARLKRRPAQLESVARFCQRAPDGMVLVLNDRRAFPDGENPYVDYDNALRPGLFDGDMPVAIAPMVRVQDRAWSLAVLRARKIIVEDDIRLVWRLGLGLGYPPGG